MGRAVSGWQGPGALSLSVSLFTRLLPGAPGRQAEVLCIFEKLVSKLLGTFSQPQ
jgi:hypothetical protein